MIFSIRLMFGDNVVGLVSSFMVYGILEKVWGGSLGVGLAVVKVCLRFVFLYRVCEDGVDDGGELMEERFLFSVATAFLV